MQLPKDSWACFLLLMILLELILSDGVFGVEDSAVTTIADADSFAISTAAAASVVAILAYVIPDVAGP